jgi:hypothetical protein
MGYELVCGCEHVSVYADDITPSPMPQLITHNPIITHKPKKGSQFGYLFLLRGSHCLKFPDLDSKVYILRPCNITVIDYAGLQSIEQSHILIDVAHVLYR